MSDNQAGGGWRRIHFLSDVEEVVPNAAYKCLKCGHTTATKVEMYEHRKGFLTDCFISRLKQKYRELRGES